MKILNGKNIIYMSIIKDFFLIQAEAKIAESVNNEIKIENFEIQAKDKNIMELKSSTCKSKMFGFEYTVDHNYLMHAYTELFNYLVKKEIIISKIDVGTFFTADFVHTLPQPFIDEKEFQKRMNPTNDYPEMLKCYTIHYKKLYDLLKNYKHNVTDEYVRLGQTVEDIQYKKSSSIKKSIKSSIKRSIKRSIKKGGGKRKTKSKK